MLIFERKDKIMSTTKEVQERVAEATAKSKEVLEQARELLDHHQKYLEECGLEPGDAISFLKRDAESSPEKAKALREHEEFLEKLPKPHPNSSMATGVAGASRHASWKAI